jgi:hypothetical protein
MDRMGDVHRLIFQHGLEGARGLANSKAERLAVEAAASVLSEEESRLGIMHAGLSGVVQHFPGVLLTSVSDVVPPLLRCLVALYREMPIGLGNAWRGVVQPKNGAHRERRKGEGPRTPLGSVGVARLIARNRQNDLYQSRNCRSSWPSLSRAIRSRRAANRHNGTCSSSVRALAALRSYSFAHAHNVAGATSNW